MSTTAIIGHGNMGQGLAKRLAGKTDLVIGARDIATATAFAATLPAGVTVLDVDAAIAKADVVVLALPYAASLAIAAHPALAGKIVVDISNPVTPDFSGLSLGFTSSAAEEIQAAAPKAKVVKAFNTIFSAVLGLTPDQTAKVPVFLAGNDDAAVATVAGLVKDAGFAVEATGKLDTARLLEPLGMLNIKFGFGLGKGTSVAPSWVSVG